MMKIVTFYYVLSGNVSEPVGACAGGPVADLLPVAMEIPQASLAGVGLLPVSVLSSSLVPDVVDLQCNVLSFSHSLILPFSFSHSLILPFSHSSILSFSHSPILSFSHSPILSFSHSPILTVIVIAIYTVVTAHTP